MVEISVNLTQPRIMWEESLKEEMCRRGKPVGMHVRNSLGMIEVHSSTLCSHQYHELQKVFLHV